MFAPVVLLIGIYKVMLTLGLTDSILGLVFINAAFNQAFTIWLLLQRGAEHGEVGVQRNHAHIQHHQVQQRPQDYFLHRDRLLHGFVHQ